MYKHGIYTKETDTQTTSTAETTVAQVVIGTAPIHWLDDPSKAVNKPILCSSISDCKSKIGYSEDFEKYTLCQAMYASFNVMGVAPVVFINVLDPTKHKTAVADTSCTVSDNSITIDDDVIVSSLVIKKDSSVIAKTDYATEWNDGILTVNFTEEQSGTVTASYDKIDTSKVTEADIVGAYNTETEVRTGMEVIKNVYPQTGVIPFILTAPGWTTSDTVGAVLAEKTKDINGCFTASAILDLDTTIATTKANAITAKKNRTVNENCIITYPMIKKGDYVISYSAWLSALIMYQATKTDGVTCKSPSNQKISIDDCVLSDGTAIYYDQEDGNELNAEGIVTIIARNGWYTWGNNTAVYPDETDPIKRWIMTRLSFSYIEDDFINSNYDVLDGALNSKMVEDLITKENVKLASMATAGYIIGGTMKYYADDNSSENILNGKFTCRTSLAANIPGEQIENIFSFDTATLESAITGGAQ